MKFKYIILATTLIFPVNDLLAQKAKKKTNAPIGEVLAKRDSMSQEYYRRQQEFLAFTLEVIMEDSLAMLNFDLESENDAFQMNMADSLQALSQALHDYVGDELRKRDLGAEIPVVDFGKIIQSVTKLFKSKRKVPQIKNMPLPTPLELEIMTVLWEEKRATGPDLYASIDTTMLKHVTAEMFWRELRSMAKKGFVSEKMVSPQHIFTVLGFPIEVSGKNRRNRVYQYQTLVDEEDLMAYIGARHYLARREETTPAQAGTRSKYTENLLMQMLENRHQKSENDVLRNE